MGSLSDFSENELLDHVLNAAYTPPSAFYLALATADPTDAATGGSMNEVANLNGYARTAITVGAASSRRVTQDAVVTFPQATGSWGTASHWSIVDNSTYGAGNVLASGAFVIAKSIGNGNTPSVASTEVYVEFSAGEISDYLSEGLLNLMFNNTAFAITGTTYIAAIITNPVTDSMTGSTITEPVGNGYARIAVKVNGGASPTWDLASSGLVDNTHELPFPAASGGNWGLVLGYAVVSAATNGNLLFYDNGATDEQVDDGDTLKHPIGEFDITMT